jgi:hypothetical protein
MTTPIPPDFKQFAKGLPSRENCDLSSPYEMFLWMFVALPYAKGGPLIMPIDYYQFVSKRLYELGAMLQCPSCGHVQEPALKYQSPLSTEAHWATSPGQWVPNDVPDRDPRTPAAKAVDGLVTQQATELFKELWKRQTPAQRRALIEAVDEEPA